MQGVEAGVVEAFANIAAGGDEDAGIFVRNSGESVGDLLAFFGGLAAGEQDDVLDFAGEQSREGFGVLAAFGQDKWRAAFGDGG